MKNYARVGNRKGRPAYRTPSFFKGKSIIRNLKNKAAGKVRGKDRVI